MLGHPLHAPQPHTPHAHAPVCRRRPTPPSLQTLRDRWTDSASQETDSSLQLNMASHRHSSAPACPLKAPRWPPAPPGRGSQAPAPRLAASPPQPPPDPLYKKKRRQHLPLDAPGSPSLASPAQDPWAQGRSAILPTGHPRGPLFIPTAAPRVLCTAHRCRGLGWPLW